MKGGPCAPRVALSFAGYLAPRAGSFSELAARLDPAFAHLPEAGENFMALEGQVVGDLSQKLEGPRPRGPVEGRAMY